jgi:Fe-S cluster assembly iron-binding protein IscA
MHETTKKCYKKYKHYFTPEKTYNELKSIAAQVGSCAGVVYDMSLKITKKRNDKCLNDPKWTKVINNYNANKP